MKKILIQSLFALASTLTAGSALADCDNCAKWNTEQAPFALYGNTYYVGVHGLSAVLITSPSGHVLIDGGLPQSAPLVEAHIRQLGFRPEDIKYILSSHTHFDHAGAIAELQRISGATVIASASSAKALQAGHVGDDDPQFGDSTPFTPIANVRIAHDGEVLQLGAAAVTAHLTFGHTPGSTSWTWQSCADGQCENMVYADSLSAVSNDTYKFIDHPAYVAAMEHSFDVVASLPCDVMVSAHPEFSDLWTREAKRAQLGQRAFIDSGACRTYAANARAGLAQRLAEERKAQ
jgi:metallo-beta-lactamase class B